MKTIDEEINASSFSSPANKALINLFYTYFKLYNNQQDYFQQFDLLPQHYNVMRIIKGRHPDPVTPGHIINSMLDKKRDLTRLIDKLEMMDLVVRAKNTSNKRMMLINLTANGLEVFDKINLGLDEACEHGLNDADCEQISYLLDKMRSKK